MSTFVPGDVVVVKKGSAPGPYPHLAIVESDNGARCLITGRAPDGSERMRGEFTENLRAAPDEEREGRKAVG